MMTNYLIVFLSLIFCLPTHAQTNPTFSAEKDRVISLPGLGAVEDVQFAGLLPLQPPQASTAAPANLFYWYVENRAQRPDAPIVLWLNGGPGAASMYGFFMENGPYSVNEKGILTKRHYSWTAVANYLAIDQPAGVGLSYGEKNTYANEAEAMDQLHDALIVFFQRHPKLATHPLYLAGESYAGKYLPQLAIRLINDKRTNPAIKLSGLLVGDAWVNPRIQQSANADFAYSHGLIDQKAKKQVEKLYQDCVQEIDKKSPSSHKANQVCAQIQEFIKKESGNLNLANVATGTEPDDSAMIQYLNNPAVRQALHIDKRLKQFNTFSAEVADQLEIGEQDSVAHLYPQLLAAGVKILIFNGLEDGKDSNFMSTNLWLAALNWPFKREFSQAPTCVWHVQKQVAGYAKAAGGLTQVNVRNAGHLAPIDQPERLLDLFERFINNKPFC